MPRTSPSLHLGLDDFCAGLRVFEPLLVMLASLGAYIVRHQTAHMPPPYIALTLLGAAAYASLSGPSQLYTPATVRAGLLGLPRLAWVLGLSLVPVVVVLFLLKISSTYSRAWLLGWAAAVTLLLLGVRLLAAWYIARQTRRGLWLRRVAVYGSGGRAKYLTGFITSRPTQLLLTALYPYKTAAVPLKKMLADAHKHKFDDMIFAMPLDSFNNPAPLLDFLHQLPLNVYYCLPLPLYGRMAHEGDFAGLPLVLLYRRPVAGYRLMLKRVLDVALAALLLLLLGPLFLLLALLVKATSCGTVFFRQQRQGFGGEPFILYKFRSMKTGSGQKQAMKQDTRLTSIGGWLRRTSLDELPQLFNVLQGHMSLVGPRPHLPSHNSAYQNTVNLYASRHKMLPGLTGWAQLNGWRGETQTLGDMAKRVEHDIWYIENWSFWLDLRIIALTPLVMLFQRRAY